MVIRRASACAKLSTPLHQDEEEAWSNEMERKAAFFVCASTLDLCGSAERSGGVAVAEAVAVGEGYD